MNANWTLKLFSLCVCALNVSAREPESASPAEQAARESLMQEIRNRIIWYTPEKTSPLLIPEDVIGLVPYEELPVPEDDRDGIRMWISFQRDWKSPAGQTAPECRYPRRADNRPVLPEHQKTVEEAIAEGPVSLLVSVDKTTRGYWRHEGIYQYNEFTPLKLLVGTDFPYQDPLSARAFLSEGGEIVVEGTRLCTVSPWQKEPPRQGDTYLLVGAPDDRGIFYQNYYFRVDSGTVLFANYSSLKEPTEPLSLDRIELAIAKAALVREIRDRILWLDEEKSTPRLIPEDVFELAPFEELPIPEGDRQGIRLWLGFRREWRSRFGQPFQECSLPWLVSNQPVRPEEQITVEKAIAAGPVSLLVKVDKTTRGLWPVQGIYQFNEVTPLEVLVGESFPYRNPFSTRAFMSEGGEIVVDGTRLCTFSPWHSSAPRLGDTYLLVGAPDDQGVFQATYYFRVEGDAIVPATYADLKVQALPLSLEQ